MRNDDDPPAQAHATRCWLVPWSTAARAGLAEAKSGTFKPELAIDVLDDVIEVVDLETNKPITAAPLAHATATPAKRMGSTPGSEPCRTKHILSSQNLSMRELFSDSRSTIWCSASSFSSRYS